MPPAIKTGHTLCDLPSYAWPNPPAERMEKLPAEERARIYGVIDAMLRHFKQGNPEAL